jgi:hypothetical protein
MVTFFLANGESPTTMDFQASGRTYHIGYYFADGIYLKRVIFVNPLQSLHGKK